MSDLYAIHHINTTGYYGFYYLSKLYDLTGKDYREDEEVLKEARQYYEDNHPNSRIARILKEPFSVKSVNRVRQGGLIEMTQELGEYIKKPTVHNLHTDGNDAVPVLKNEVLYGMKKMERLIDELTTILTLNPSHLTRPKIKKLKKSLDMMLSLVHSIN